MILYSVPKYVLQGHYSRVGNTGKRKTKYRVLKEQIHGESNAPAKKQSKGVLIRSATQT